MRRTDPLPPVTASALAALLIVALAGPPLAAQSPAASAPARTGAGTEGPSTRFQPMDVFGLEYASDPQIAPDGRAVVYVRRSMDVRTDRRRSTLWIVDTQSGEQRPLLDAEAPDASSPRWSPDGGRLLYVASDGDGGAQLHVRWMDGGQTARLTQLEHPPSGLSWSPDGTQIAFSMLVREKPEPLVELPTPPEGAEWADPPQVIEHLTYRFDGAGNLAPGHHQLFVLPAEGGTPRQLTAGPWDHEGTPSWTPDGSALVFSANREEDAELDPLDSEVYELTLADGSVRALTDRQGPDDGALVAPDGSAIAYLGFDDRLQGYQVTRLHVMDRDGGEPRVLTAGLDRDVEAPRWDADGRGLFFQYDDHGDTTIAHVSLAGEIRAVFAGLGGTSLDRPYGGGSFSVARDGQVAFTRGSAWRPADVALGLPGSGQARSLTRLNEDLLGHKTLGAVEEITFASAHDGRPIQGWVVTPPDFDPGRKHPLVLEIHGGPFANYGPRFSVDAQLYAAAGYVVLYCNPRGSTSYGEEFGNAIHHAYPGHDYDDLMAGVDAVLERGYVDGERLYVTGGSGGGVLSAWIVGKTRRFRAAVVAKPVINWTSFGLTADAYNYFWKYWFPAYPWDDPEHWWSRSPLSLVGQVQTPTMLLTGEQDHRTPITESEQYYQALKLRGIETALVRIPGASHDIDDRPSQMLAKALCTLAWFERHGGEDGGK